MDVRDALEGYAREQGLLSAWAALELPERIRRRYRDWIEQGGHAGMDYLGRRLEERLEPSRRFAWARSVLVLAAAHAYPDPGLPDGGLRLGRVARYAWVRDYHELLRPHLAALESLARQSGVQAKGYVDHGPLSERSYAALGGLGWIGKNGMWMRMEEGSYLTLAVLLTELEAPPASLHPNRCGRCARCHRACPTQALPGDGTLDARRCISYWTIEHRGPIPQALWAGMGDWLLGCDVCQEVCPWNRRAALFWRGFTPEPELAHPDLWAFLELSSRAFARRFEGTVYTRPGRAALARNALIVLFNTGDDAYLPYFRRALQDVNPVVRATAAAAMVRLGRAAEAEAALRDPSATVASYVREALEGMPDTGHTLLKVDRAPHPG
ncbi:tRNA epoxyqueuosine(34) reductase QueG [Calidithermus timidus]|uniref:tRNA epoxyqueuosine(34) reductase QueG n=1 Tax=Calidithermus timidus TaxID=307124 RepID=UPI00036A42C6|nr:tRNA epoxyqueuosine(34) reductase QueG [Calidithermus timidus]